ncbi:putative inner membrane protein translocase component YidC [Oceanicola granulosus HTCC2516]|uniref:Membrane protein insertase YidC n=1 Tax=Oceanicola granulosus (strain ATCC BAA-861 / DSM 15982 / KCTC 12143 / HTCC2516) TaxID=314256 RepID=Q2CI02_OCEGH|nr:membrane protein insertase YidC [Oceanicola granulosus]EAR52456.1 putative inner membrane protein translocase component YidC [Oceanicola granulosus HTCC2516]
MDDQNKNLILATALSFIVILIWFVLFPPPEQAPGLTNAEGEVVAQDDTALRDEMSPDGAIDGTAAGTPVATLEQDAPVEAARVAIETPRLVGSINTAGGRIDDLKLTAYHETLDPDSPLVRLLSPGGEEAQYYALHGWIALSGASADEVPGDSTVWEIEEGETLTPDSPVVLRWENGAGLVFRKTIAVDDNYLFTVTQSVENTTGDAVELRPYGQVRRHGLPDSRQFFILHEGVVRMADGELEEIDYDDLPDLTAEESRIEVAEDGWVGFTDKYWMTTLVPASGTPFRSVAREVNGIYLTESIYPPVAVAAGETVSAESHVFAGAKEWETIRAYEAAGIDRFVDSIDWGWFFFLTKPIFALLHWLNGVIGNMGWSIIVLTLIIKAVLFPLAYKSYASMAKMKELQPEMEKLKERAGDDRQALQKGMMELYKTNKVNPASGCLPILLQIPIFFSLYKVIFVTLELRHAPWIGWIRDLSAPDPSSILNLFGLLPWDTPDPGSIFFIFSLGVLPILLGISMWLQQKLNPAPPDPTQRMIFAWMPWVFMFMLGSFASGLVIYWIANNMITFTQQYLIMRSHGYKPDILGNIRGKGAAAAKK